MKKKALLFLVLPLALLAGCATVSHYPGDMAAISVPGDYHEVKKGETLWGIARLHNLPLERVVAVNRLPDASKIEVGQLIFIPEPRESARGKVARKSASLENFIWPVEGRVVSYFGSMKDYAKNKGVDVETRAGARVSAARSGTVTFASDHLKGYGKTIIIDHHDGYETVYAYNAKNLVRVNDEVAQGDRIAEVGKTGRATRPTLHFEIRKNHKPQNPFYYLP